MACPTTPRTTATCWPASARLRAAASVILGFAARPAPAGRRVWPGISAPNQFLNWGEDRLLGYTRYGNARLDVLDADLEPTGRMITGVATDMVLDDAAGRLYVADDHDQVHVIGLPDGQPLGVWDGGAPWRWTPRTSACTST